MGETPHMGAETELWWCELVSVLEGTYSPDANIRGEAEAFLKAASPSQGLLRALLLIIRHSEVDTAVRTAAAVHLKNEIRMHWEAPLSEEEDDEAKAANATSVYAEEEKAELRRELYPLIRIVDKNAAPVRLQLIECFRLVAAHDFPERWPEALPSLVQDLQGGATGANLDAALLVLRKLVAVFEFRGRETKQHLDAVIEATWPLILPTTATLLQQRSCLDEEAMTQIKLALKIYWSCTQFCLTSSPLIVTSVDNWMELIEAVLKLQVPSASLEGLDASERSALAVYKSKKWALQIVQRIFSRYVEQKALKRTLKREGGDSSVKAFGQRFMDGWARRLTELVLLLLRQHSLHQTWLSPRMQNLTLQFLSVAVESAALYAPLIKPNGDFLVFDVCLPLMHYTPQDEETWLNEPIDFIRSQSDPLGAFSDPREAAIEFVQSLARYRAVDFLGRISEALHQMFTRYREASEAAGLGAVLPEELCKAKDGALVVAGSLADRLASKRRAAPLEQLLSLFVVPDMQSPNKFLRLRSAWCFSEVGSRVQKWKDPALLLLAYEQMTRLLVDSELPVRVQAAVSLKVFFGIEDAQLQQRIVDQLKPLAARLLELMQEVDSEQLIETLEEMVSHFEEHIAPLAKDLARALAATLVGIFDREGTAAMSRDDVAEGDASFAAVAVLSTLKTVLGSVAETPQLYVDIAPELYPVLEVLFTPDGIDHLEDALMILSYLTFYLPAPFPAPLWRFYAAIFQAVCGGSTPSKPLPEALENGWAADFFELMLPPLSNFMGRDPEAFVKGQTELGMPFPQCALMMAQFCFKELDKTEAYQGLRLLTALLVATAPSRSCDTLLQPLLESVWAWVRQSDPCKAAKKSFIQFVCAMLIYSNEATLELLRRLEISEAVFAFVVEHLSLVDSASTRRLFVLAFAPLVRAVCVSPGSPFPDALRSGCGHLLRALAEAGAAMRRNKEEGRGEDASDAESDADSEQSLDETQDAEPAQQIPSVLEKLQDAWEDEDDEEWDEDEDAVEDDELQFDPLSSVDAFAVLGKALEGLPAETAQEIQRELGTDGVAKLVSSRLRSSIPSSKGTTTPAVR